MITPDQRDKLMLSPRMHLELVVTGYASLDHFESVLGAFNTGSALAFYAKDVKRQAMIHRSLDILASCISQTEAGVVTKPSDDEAAFLMAAFNQLERWIGVQNQLQLARAILFVEQSIQKKGGANALSLAGSSIK